MGLSFNYIKRNIRVYLSTLIIFIILSYLLLFAKNWSNSYLSLSSQYDNFLFSQSIAIEKNSTQNSLITISEVDEVEKILSEYDSSIQNISYRLELAGIVQYQDRESQFYGVGIDFNRDKDFIDRYLSLTGGEENLTSQNFVLVSKSLGEKLQVQQNENLELYVLRKVCK